MYCFEVSMFLFWLEFCVWFLCFFLVLGLLGVEYVYIYVCRCFVENGVGFKV